jgi:hypothetical protein
LREKAQSKDYLVLVQILHNLSQMENLKITLDLCQHLFILAATIGDPLTPKVEADFQYFAKLLHGYENDHSELYDAVRVALTALSQRVKCWK